MTLTCIHSHPSFSTLFSLQVQKFFFSSNSRNTEKRELASQVYFQTNFLCQDNSFCFCFLSMLSPPFPEGQGLVSVMGRTIEQTRELRRRQQQHQQKSITSPFVHLYNRQISASSQTGVIQVNWQVTWSIKPKTGAQKEYQEADIKVEERYW